MLVSNFCRCKGEKPKNKKGFKSCGNFRGQRNMTCPGFKNNYGCNENCRRCGCENKFGKWSLLKRNGNIFPKKRFREKRHHHRKDSTEDFLQPHGIEVVQRKWSNFENVFVCGNKIGEKSVGQIVKS